MTWFGFARLIGGLNPARSLAVTLDVGTNNEDLLNDPLYVVNTSGDYGDGYSHPSFEGMAREARQRRGVRQICGYVSRFLSRLSLSTRTSSNHYLILSVFRFVQIVRKYYPHSLLHFEDFGVTNAHTLLERYRDTHAVFNDDMCVPRLNYSAYRIQVY